MALEIPEWAQGIEGLEWVVGADWPHADEDQVRAIGQVLQAASGGLNEVVPSVEKAGSGSLEAYPAGDGHDAMADVFAALTSGDASVEQLGELFGVMADWLDGFGIDVTATKANGIIALAWLMAELSWAAAAGPGAPFSEAGALISGRAVFSRIGARLTELIASKMLGRSLSKMWSEFVAKLIYEVLQEGFVEAFQGVGQELIVQKITGKSDLKALGVTAAVGAIAGSAGGLAGSLTGTGLAAVAPWSTRGGWGGRFGALITGGTAGAFGAVTGWAAQGAITDQWGWEWRSFTSGISSAGTSMIYGGRGQTEYGGAGSGTSPFITPSESLRLKQAAVAPTQPVPRQPAADVARPASAPASKTHVAPVPESKVTSKTLSPKAAPVPQAGSVPPTKVGHTPVPGIAAEHQVGTADVPPRKAKLFGIIPIDEGVAKGAPPPEQVPEPAVPDAPEPPTFSIDCGDTVQHDLLRILIDDQMPGASSDRREQACVAIVAAAQGQKVKFSVEEVDGQYRLRCVTPDGGASLVIDKVSLAPIAPIAPASGVPAQAHQELSTLLVELNKRAELSHLPADDPRQRQRQAYLDATLSQGLALVDMLRHAGMAGADVAALRSPQHHKTELESLRDHAEILAPGQDSPVDRVRAATLQYHASGAQRAALSRGEHPDVAALSDRQFRAGMAELVGAREAAAAAHRAQAAEPHAGVRAVAEMPPQDVAAIKADLQILVPAAAGSPELSALVDELSEAAETLRRQATPPTRWQRLHVDATYRRAVALVEMMGGARAFGGDLAALCSPTRYAAELRRISQHAHVDQLAAATGVYHMASKARDALRTGDIRFTPEAGVRRAVHRAMPGLIRARDDATAARAALPAVRKEYQRLTGELASPVPMPPVPAPVCQPKPAAPPQGSAPPVRSVGVGGASTAASQMRFITVQRDGSPVSVAIVTSGVDGFWAGGRAAEVAAEAARKYLRWALPRDGGVPACVVGAMVAAQHAVMRLIKREYPGVARPPASTIAVTVTEKGFVTSGQLGDDRIYWHGKDSAALLTGTGGYLGKGGGVPAAADRHVHTREVSGPGRVVMVNKDLNRSMSHYDVAAVLMTHADSDAAAAALVEKGARNARQHLALTAVVTQHTPAKNSPLHKLNSWIDEKLIPSISAKASAPEPPDPELARVHHTDHDPMPVFTDIHNPVGLADLAAQAAATGQMLTIHVNSHPSWFSRERLEPMVGGIIAAMRTQPGVPYRVVSRDLRVLGYFRQWAPKVVERIALLMPDEGKDTLNSAWLFGLREPLAPARDYTSPYGVVPKEARKAGATRLAPHASMLTPEFRRRAWREGLTVVVVPVERFVGMFDLNDSSTVGVEMHLPSTQLPAGRRQSWFDRLITWFLPSGIAKAAMMPQDGWVGAGPELLARYAAAVAAGDAATVAEFDAQVSTSAHPLNVAAAVDAHQAAVAALEESDSADPAERRRLRVRAQVAEARLHDLRRDDRELSRSEAAATEELSYAIANRADVAAECAELAQGSAVDGVQLAPETIDATLDAALIGDLSDAQRELLGDLRVLARRWKKAELDVRYFATELCEIRPTFDRQYMTESHEALESLVEEQARDIRGYLGEFDRWVPLGVDTADIVRIAYALVANQQLSRNEQALAAGLVRVAESHQVDVAKLREFEAEMPARTAARQYIEAFRRCQHAIATMDRDGAALAADLMEQHAERFAQQDDPSFGRQGQGIRLGPRAAALYAAALAARDNAQDVDEQWTADAGVRVIEAQLGAAGSPVAVVRAHLAATAGSHGICDANLVDLLDGTLDPDVTALSAAINDRAQAQVELANLQALDGDDESRQIFIQEQVVSIRQAELRIRWHAARIGTASPDELPVMSSLHTYLTDTAERICEAAARISFGVNPFHNFGGVVDAEFLYTGDDAERIGNVRGDLLALDLATQVYDTAAHQLNALDRADPVRAYAAAVTQRHRARALLDAAQSRLGGRFDRRLTVDAKVVDVAIALSEHADHAEAAAMVPELAGVLTDLLVAEQVQKIAAAHIGKKAAAPDHKTEGSAQQRVDQERVDQARRNLIYTLRKRDRIGQLLTDFYERHQVNFGLEPEVIDLLIGSEFTKEHPELVEELRDLVQGLKAAELAARRFAVRLELLVTGFDWEQSRLLPSGDDSDALRDAYWAAEARCEAAAMALDQVVAQQPLWVDTTYATLESLAEAFLIPADVRAEFADAHQQLEAVQRQVLEGGAGYPVSLAGDPVSSVERALFEATRSDETQTDGSGDYSFEPGGPQYNCWWDALEQIDPELVPDGVRDGRGVQLVKALRELQEHGGEPRTFIPANPGGTLADIKQKLLVRGVGATAVVAAAYDHVLGVVVDSTGADRLITAHAFTMRVVADLVTGEPTIEGGDPSDLRASEERVDAFYAVFFDEGRQAVVGETVDLTEVPDGIYVGATPTFTLQPGDEANLGVWLDEQLSGVPHEARDLVVKISGGVGGAARVAITVEHVDGEYRVVVAAPGAVKLGPRTSDAAARLTAGRFTIAKTSDGTEFSFVFDEDVNPAPPIGQNAVRVRLGALHTLAEVSGELSHLVNVVEKQRKQLVEGPELSWRLAELDATRRRAVALVELAKAAGELGHDVARLCLPGRYHAELARYVDTENGAVGRLKQAVREYHNAGMDRAAAKHRDVPMWTPDGVRERVDQALPGLIQARDDARVVRAALPHVHAKAAPAAVPSADAGDPLSHGPAANDPLRRLVRWVKDALSPESVAKGAKSPRATGVPREVDVVRADLRILSSAASVSEELTDLVGELDAGVEQLERPAADAPPLQWRRAYVDATRRQAQALVELARVAGKLDHDMEVLRSPIRHQAALEALDQHVTGPHSPIGRLIAMVREYHVAGRIRSRFEAAISPLQVDIGSPPITPAGATVRARRDLPRLTIARDRAAAAAAALPEIQAYHQRLIAEHRPPQAPMSLGPARTELSVDGVAGVSNTGRLMRRKEDAMGGATLLRDGKPVGVALVADGVTGSADGHRAAETARSAAMDHLRRTIPLGGDVETCVLGAINAAQRAVTTLIEAKYATSAKPPACSLMITVVSKGKVTVGGLGNSRVYLLDGTNSRQLTMDHTSSKGRLARWVGRGGGLPLDTAHQYVATRSVSGKVRVLLCTKSLSLNLSPIQAADIVAQHRTLPSAATALVDATLLRDGARDTTAVLAQHPPVRPRSANPAADDPLLRLISKVIPGITAKAAMYEPQLVLTGTLDQPHPIVAALLQWSEITEWLRGSVPGLHESATVLITNFVGSAMENTAGEVVVSVAPVGAGFRIQIATPGTFDLGSDEHAEARALTDGQFVMETTPDGGTRAAFVFTSRALVAPDDAALADAAAQATQIIGDFTDFTAEDFAAGSEVWIRVLNQMSDTVSAANFDLATNLSDVFRLQMVATGAASWAQLTWLERVQAVLSERGEPDVFLGLPLRARDVVYRLRLAQQLTDLADLVAMDPGAIDGRIELQFLNGVADALARAARGGQRVQLLHFDSAEQTATVVIGDPEVYPDAAPTYCDLNGPSDALAPGMDLALDGHQQRMAEENDPAAVVTVLRFNDHAPHDVMSKIRHDMHLVIAGLARYHNGREIDWPIPSRDGLTISYVDVVARAQQQPVSEAEYRLPPPTTTNPTVIQALEGAQHCASVMVWLYRTVVPDADVDVSGLGDQDSQVELKGTPGESVAMRLHSDYRPGGVESVAAGVEELREPGDIVVLALDNPGASRNGVATHLVWFRMTDSCTIVCFDPLELPWPELKKVYQGRADAVDVSRYERPYRASEWTVSRLAGVEKIFAIFRLGGRAEFPLAAGQLPTGVPGQDRPSTLVGKHLGGGREPDDAETVAAAVSGDESARRRLFLWHAPAVRLVASFLVDTAQVAETFVEKAFADVYRALGEHGSRGVAFGDLLAAAFFAGWHPGESGSQGTDLDSIGGTFPSGLQQVLEVDEQTGTVRWRLGLGSVHGTMSAQALEIYVGGQFRRLDTFHEAADLLTNSRGQIATLCVVAERDGRGQPLILSYEDGQVMVDDLTGRPRRRWAPMAEPAAESLSAMGFYRDGQPTHRRNAVGRDFLVPRIDTQVLPGEVIDSDPPTERATVVRHPGISPREYAEQWLSDSDDPASDVESIIADLEVLRSRVLRDYRSVLSVGMHIVIRGASSTIAATDVRGVVYGVVSDACQPVTVDAQIPDVTIDERAQRFHVDVAGHTVIGRFVVRDGYLVAVAVVQDRMMLDQSLLGGLGGVVGGLPGTWSGNPPGGWSELAKRWRMPEGGGDPAKWLGAAQASRNVFLRPWEALDAGPVEPPAGEQGQSADTPASSLEREYQEAVARAERAEAKVQELLATAQAERDGEVDDSPRADQIIARIERDMCRAECELLRLELITQRATGHPASGGNYQQAKAYATAFARYAMLRRDSERLESQLRANLLLPESAERLTVDNACPLVAYLATVAAADPGLVTQVEEFARRVAEFRVATAVFDYHSAEAASLPDESSAAPYDDTSTGWLDAGPELLCQYAAAIVLRDAAAAEVALTWEDQARQVERAAFAAEFDTQVRAVRRSRGLMEAVAEQRAAALELSQSDPSVADEHRRRQVRALVSDSRLLDALPEADGTGSAVDRAIQRCKTAVTDRVALEFTIGALAEGLPLGDVQLAPDTVDELLDAVAARELSDGQRRALDEVRHYAPAWKKSELDLRYFAVVLCETRPGPPLPDRLVADPRDKSEAHREAEQRVGDSADKVRHCAARFGRWIGIGTDAEANLRTARELASRNDLSPEEQLLAAKLVDLADAHRADTVWLRHLEAQVPARRAAQAYRALFRGLRAASQRQTPTRDGEVPMFTDYLRRRAESFAQQDDLAFRSDGRARLGPKAAAIYAAALVAQQNAQGIDARMAADAAVRDVEAQLAGAGEVIAVVRAHIAAGTPVIDGEPTITQRMCEANLLDLDTLDADVPVTDQNLQDMVRAIHERTVARTRLAVLLGVDDAAQIDATTVDALLADRHSDPEQQLMSAVRALKAAELRIRWHASRIGTYPVDPTG